MLNPYGLTVGDYSTLDLKMKNLTKIIPLREMIMDHIRILILEDLRTDADLIEFELQEAGIHFTSQRTTTEKDYARALREFSPHLILADYDLPQYTGSLALEAAKTLCPGVPFILVTGFLGENDARRWKIVAQGARECVSKDHLEQLAPAILKVLEAKSGNGSAAGKRDS